MHEPHSSGVRRITHFVRVEVVMRLSVVGVGCFVLSYLFVSDRRHRLLCIWSCTCKFWTPFAIFFWAGVFNSLRDDSVIQILGLGNCRKYVRRRQLICNVLFILENDLSMPLFHSTLRLVLVTTHCRYLLVQCYCCSNKSEALPFLI